MKMVANNAKKSVTVSEDAHHCRYVPMFVRRATFEERDGRVERRSALVKVRGDTVCQRCSLLSERGTRTSSSAQQLLLRGLTFPPSEPVEGTHNNYNHYHIALNLVLHNHFSLSLGICCTNNQHATQPTQPPRPAYLSASTECRYSSTSHRRRQQMHRLLATIQQDRRRVGPH
jgi:hypothetical protein